jgi:NADH-quinone oxidoreductase subunit M
MSYLLWLFIAPFLTSVIAFFVPCKRFALLLSLLPLLLLLIAGPSDLLGQNIEHSWLPDLSIFFHLKMDSLSLLFIYLVAIITPFAIVAVEKEAKTFYGLILMTQGLLIGFFLAADLVLFTLFWEALLLPLYFIIVLYGGEERRLAGMKFLIYMIAGSAFMVAGVLALYFSSLHHGAGTFNIAQLSASAHTLPYYGLVAAIFLLAFAVKTPLFPFHGWLPDVYCQAPTAGSILLAALLSKAGIYGIIRISLGIFPAFMAKYSYLFLALAIIGVLYSALAAWRQYDFKRLFAYSSLSHVNFILAGLFVVSNTAHVGAIFQALNHGITIAALFLVGSWLEDRIGDRIIGKTSGLATYMPKLCWLSFLIVLASVALPGTNNFIGELLILLGVFHINPIAAAILGLAVILSVIYMLRFMQKIFFERPSPYSANYRDIGIKKLAIAAPLIVLIFFFGFYPMPALHYAQQYIDASSHEGVLEPHA